MSLPTSRPWLVTFPASLRTPSVLASSLGVAPSPNHAQRPRIPHAIGDEAGAGAGMGRKASERGHLRRCVDGAARRTA